MPSDMRVPLNQANLNSIALELEYRATHTIRCPNCHGQHTMAAMFTCAECSGTGYSPWPELHDIADRLRCLTMGLPI